VATNRLPGEWLSEVFVLPVAKHDAQGGGSCVSYARRYALAAFVGVCPEDDDGNAAADSSANLRRKGLENLQAASKQGLDALKKASTVITSPSSCVVWLLALPGAQGWDGISLSHAPNSVAKPAMTMTH